MCLEALGRFVADREASGCSPKTIFTYRYWISRYIDYLHAHQKQVATATDSDIRGFAVDEINPRYARSTARLILSAAKTFHRWLFENDLMKGNPARTLRLPRPTTPIRPILKRPQIEQLLDYFNANRFFGARNRCMLILMLNTGARIGEVTKLTLNDYDGAEHEVLVRDTKNGEDRRVPVSEDVCAEIDDYLKRWRSKIPGPWLFPRSLGERLKTTQVNKIFLECAQALGMKLHPHMCRRTFATTMLQNGASLEAVRRILGHKSLASTTVYLQTDMDYLKQQHDLFTPTKGLL